MKKVIIIFLIILFTGYGIIIFGDRLFNHPKITIVETNKESNIELNGKNNEQTIIETPLIAKNENNIIKTPIETKVNEEPHTQLIVNENDYDVEQLRDGTLAITCYYGNGTHIPFPAKLFGINVSEIKLYMYHQEKKINSFFIENGIKKISSNSFGNLITSQKTSFSFNNIIIPNSITEIGDRAFFRSLANDTKVNLQLPNGLKRIGDEAFSGYRKYFGGIYTIHVNNIILPKTLEYVGRRAFAELTIDYLRIENEFGINTSPGQEVIINILSDETQEIFSNSTIRCIEICANLSEKWLNYVFNDRNFINFYLSQNRKSGIYLYNGRLWTVGTRQDVNNILAGNDNFNSSQKTTSKPSYSGTTRDPQFQKEYEEALGNNPHIMVLPNNLVLPNGETVQERVESGNISGK